MLETFHDSGAKLISAGSPAEARAAAAARREVAGSGPDMAEVRDFTIPGRTHGINARLYRPHGDQPGTVVYLHGGGWVIGCLDDFDLTARVLADRSKRSVVMPDYRLAPEQPFPAALEDCEDCVLWVAQSRPKGEPIAIAGDSAGANLATVTAASLRGRVNLAMQLLAYPVTDCNFDTPSYLSESDGMSFTRDDMRWFFNHYAPPGLHSDPRISPLRNPDLSGLPPTLIITAEHDILRDEGEAYADRLRAAGVVVEFRCYRGVTHGFLRHYNHLDVARAAIVESAASLADAMGSAHS
jgi:acetyl esterase